MIAIEVDETEFAFYAKEDEPGEVIMFVKAHPDYSRLPTKEESDLVDDDLASAICYRLTLEAAERWPRWRPYADAALFEMMSDVVVEA
jgi:hypothetical protein